MYAMYLLYIYSLTRRYSPVNGKRIHWPGGKDGPPLDIPKCGFLGNAAACNINGIIINVFFSIISYKLFSLFE